MQRVLRIVLIIAFMLLLILWFSTIFNTCNKDKVADDLIENNEGSADSLDVFTDLDDEFFEDGEEVFLEGEQTENSNTNNPVESTTEDDIFETDASTDYTDYTGTPSSSPKETSSPSTSSGSSGPVNDAAKFLVVAGSYLIKDNAIRMQNKLIKMGYSAEVRNFNYSQYHSVIAGRFNDRSSADRLVSEIKTKGIDSYVHKRQY